MNGSFYKNPTFPTTIKENEEQIIEETHDESTFDESLNNLLNKEIELLSNTHEWHGILTQIKEDYITLIQDNKKHFIHKNIINSISINNE